MTIEAEDTLEFNKLRASELGAPIPPGLQDIRTVTIPKLNVRSGPGTNYNWLRYLQYGDKVNVIKVTPDRWAQISSYEWVFADYLQKTELYLEAV